MKEFKAILLVGNKEIDYMVFESKDLKSAGEYAEMRFNKAYPQCSNREDASLQIVVL